MEAQSWLTDHDNSSIDSDSPAVVVCQMPQLESRMCLCKDHEDWRWEYHDDVITKFCVDDRDEIFKSYESTPKAVLKARPSESCRLKKRTHRDDENVGEIDLTMYCSPKRIKRPAFIVKALEIKFFYKLIGKYYFLSNK